MGLENLLDFLGVNFLASSVDADAATAQQGQAAIGLDHAPVAGNRIADPIDCAERLGGFYGILVISRRDRPHESDKSRYAASRRTFPVVFVKDIAEFANRKFCGVGAHLRGCAGAAAAEPFGIDEASTEERRVRQ